MLKPQGAWGVAARGTRGVRRLTLVAASLAIGMMSTAPLARAQNATWLVSPGSGDFNTAANWSPAAVPTGTASFGFSNTTALSFSADTSIGGFTLNPGASAYNFTVGAGRTVSFTGAGITINGGSATFTNAFIVNFDNASTAGTATINNNNTLAFHNSATAGGSTIVNNDFLQFFDGTSAGSSALTNNHNTSFFATSTAGSANISNSSVVEFFQTSTAGSATITNTSSLTFNDSATAGNATITNSSSGVTQFVGNSTGGNARLINNAGGLFLINANGPILTVGSIEGAGTFSIGGGAQLTVGTNNLSTTVSGVITSSSTFETLTKVGTGTLTLTGTNTFLGAMTVNGGTLEVDGSIAAARAVFVNAGGTLSGTGIVDPVSTQIASGGTLAPGNAANPTGVLTVTGSLSFASGAIYLVQVSGANAGKTNVAGAGFLGGTVNVGVIGGAQANTNYDILHAAGGLNNTTFAGVQSLAPGFAPSLSYSTTDVFLTLTANLGGGSGLGANQQTGANAINTVFNNGGTLPAGFFNLFQLSGASLNNALTQISGETATGSQQTTFNAMTQFMGLLTDPFMNRGGGSGGATSPTGYAEDETLAYAARQKTDAFAMFTKAPPAPFEQRWSVWVSGFGGSQSTSGNTAVGSNNTTSNIAATAVGADYLLSPNTIAGFALAGGGTSFSVAGGGTGRSDLFQAGAYLRHTNGPAYVSAALAYGWQDITTNRSVTVAGLDQLRAEFNANAFSGRLEGGYRFVSPATLGIGITPYAAAQFVTFDLPAYAEQAIVGTNNFALASGAHDATDVRTELGFRADKSFVMPDSILTLRGRLAWAHDYDPDRSIGATFQSLPGASFVVNGAAQAADSALVTASIEKKWPNGWAVAATFEGEFSNVTSSYAGKGVVHYAW
jgi:autotransporter-associated beta strand protein